MPADGAISGDTRSKRTHMTDSTSNCFPTRVWPDIQARITGDSPCLPLFGEYLVACEYAFLDVSVPNTAFVRWFEQHWLRATKQARREIVLALDPSYGTHETGEVLTTGLFDRFR